MKSTIIFSAIFSLFRFGDYVPDYILFSLRRWLKVVGARKNGTPDRDTGVSSGALTLSRRTYEAPATQVYVSLFSRSTIGTHALVCKLHMEIK